MKEKIAKVLSLISLSILWIRKTNSIKYFFYYLTNKSATEGNLSENNMVKSVILNCNTPLGSARENIHLPNDDAIFKSVLAKGVWNYQNAAFLSKIINKSGDDSTFIDLGANVGLITKEVMALTSHMEVNFVVVEPLPFHLSALRKNINSKTVEIIGKAFSPSGENIYINLDLSNLGNSSLFPEILSHSRQKQESIQCAGISAPDFEKSVEKGKIILKSDMQGAESFVFASFSDKFWERLEGGVIEVLTHPKIRIADVEVISAQLAQFKFLSWSSSSLSRTTIKEILNFWIQKDFSQRDLYFRR